jgi:hypothetical protein
VTVKSCGPDVSTLTFNLVTMLAHRTGDGGKKSPITRESPKQAVKTIARGMPECFDVPVVNYSYAFYFACEASVVDLTFAPIPPRILQANVKSKPH